jgi:hypothetical protein
MRKPYLFIVTVLFFWFFLELLSNFVTVDFSVLGGCTFAVGRLYSFELFGIVRNGKMKELERGNEVVCP